jgi:hypothetical protein
VEKRPSANWRIATRLVRNYPELILSPGKLVRRARSVADRRARTVSGLFSRRIDRALVGNAVLAGDRILQDRVMPLGDCLARGDDPRALIDLYINSIHATWGEGFAETSFNFTVNHGLDAEGRVIVLDVGELTFDREEVRQLIDASFWMGAFSIQSLSQEIREYALRSMNARLTRAHLRAIWRDSEPVYRIPTADDRPAVSRERHTSGSEPARKTADV